MHFAGEREREAGSENLMAWVGSGAERRRRRIKKRREREGYGLCDEVVMKEEGLWRAWSTLR